MRFMQTDVEITGPLNIGNSKENSIPELAQTIIALVGSASKLEYKPLPQDDPLQRRPDITRASEIPGWEPQTDLEDGLVDIISYFENLPGSSPVR